MLRIKFLWFLGASGGLLMAAAGLSPEVAISNLSKWAEILGFSKLSERLATDSADTWVMIFGLVLVSGSIAINFIKKKENLTPKEEIKPGVEKAKTHQRSTFINLDNVKNAIISGNTLHGEGSLLIAKNVKGLKAEGNKRFESPVPKTVEQDTTEKSEVLEFIVHSSLLNISAKNLRNTTGGSTRYALYYNWNNNNNYLFDNIEGFSIKMFEYDIDEDGTPELIIEYHCGAHTMVMNVYKVTGYGSPPVLIPGATIGSDWPDIRWHVSNRNEGTVFFAKQRNWSKSPTQDFVEDKYLLKNGVCQKIA